VSSVVILLPRNIRCISVCKISALYSAAIKAFVSLCYQRRVFIGVFDINMLLDLLHIPFYVARMMFCLGFTSVCTLAQYAGDRTTRTLAFILNNTAQAPLI
jgi:hypothetical protein